MRPAPPLTGADLLDAASVLWRAHPALARGANGAWTTGFASAAAWMDEVHATVRGSSPTQRPWSLRRILQRNALGVAKNGGAALVALGVASMTGPLLAAPVFVLTFYAVEGQMVFLFPLLTDLEAAGEHLSFVGIVGRCRALTVRAGGTVAVMRVVMPISKRMIFGGLSGHGFVESWCLGCIAVVVWYERVAR